MFDLEVVGQGRTTKIYRDGDTAIKLYENASPDAAYNEAEKQRFAHGAGLPAPAVFGVRELGGGLVALDMAYIDGKPLIKPRMDKNERTDAINVLVQLQCAVHNVKADGLPKLTDRMKRFIGGTPWLDGAHKDILLNMLARLDDGRDSLCHGDIHPLNILNDGVKYWIIDWVDATAGCPLADACRTYLIFKYYISRSAGIYLRAFCKRANVRHEGVLAWLPVVAAARLHENMDDRERIWLKNIAVSACNESLSDLRA